MFGEGQTRECGKTGQYGVYQANHFKKQPTMALFKTSCILGIVHRFIRQPRCDRLWSGVELYKRPLSVFFSLASSSLLMESELAWTAAGILEESVFAGCVCRKFGLTGWIFAVPFLVHSHSGRAHHYWQSRSQTWCGPSFAENSPDLFLECVISLHFPFSAS